MKKLVTITLILVLSVFGLGQTCMGVERGGVLKMIAGTFPKNFHPNEGSPSDSIALLPVCERLVDWDMEGRYIPVLLESWSEDPINNIVVFYLKKGIRFHDGTPFNAQAAKWNFEFRMKKNRLVGADNIIRMDVIDDYTLRFVLKKLHSTFAYDTGATQMFSPTAIEKNGEEWARKNAVGTGPFKLVEFQRDTYLRYERNNDYWQKGKPYLDAMENRFIPDTMTAAALIESKEADMWLYASAITSVMDLEDKGLKTVVGPGMFFSILPDTKNPGSKYKDKRVREAIEYAIDRPTLAMLIGQGRFEALHQMAHKDFPGYVEGYNPRPYNPEKAKRLLREAGYPRGFKTKIMAFATSLDAASAIKSYLAEVGIDAQLDMADLGRYFGALFGTGWNGLVFAASGINPDSTDIFVHFGPRPWTFRTGNILKTPEYLAACEAAFQEFDFDKRMKLIQKAVVQGGEDAMIIPVYKTFEANVMQRHVHSDYLKIHGIVWPSQDQWMKRH